MSACGAAQITDPPPGKLKSKSSIYIPTKSFQLISEILSFFKNQCLHKKAVAQWVRHDSTIFPVWKIDLGGNVSPASKDGT